MSKIKQHRFKGLSLFSSAGIAEFGFAGTKVDIVIASELLQKRMDVHKFWHPHAISICGDITQREVKDKLIKNLKKKVLTSSLQLLHVKV